MACNVNKKNILSKIIIKSRKGIEFEFSNNNIQENSLLFHELGKFVLNMTSVIPNGIIIIFSTFSLLKKT